MATLQPDPSRRGWGPRPAPALGDAVSQLSKARAGALDLLAAQEAPVTVAAFARQSGQHPNTVREHLEGLCAAGLAQASTSAALGRGRPAQLYTPVPVERTRPQVREYARLAGAMAAHLARTSADPSAEARALGRHWGADLANELGVIEAASETDATAAVVTMLAALGYDPQASERRVLLRQCPVLDVARRHPEVVCQVHLGVVEGMYTAFGPVPDGLALEAFADPVGCCLLLPHRESHTRPTAHLPKTPTPPKTPGV